jgi:hypothetical protein
LLHVTFPHHFLVFHSLYHLCSHAPPLPNPDQAHLSPISLKHLSASVFHFHLSQHQNFAAKALSHSSQARIPALIIYVSIPLAVFISHKKGFSWGEQALRIAPEPRKKTIRSEQYFTVPYKYKYN